MKRNKEKSDEVKLLSKTPQIIWESYDAASKALPLNIELKTKTNKSKSSYALSKSDENIFEDAVLFILDGGMETPSSLQRKLKISLKQAKQVLEKLQKEKIKERQVEAQKRLEYSQSSEVNLYREILLWAKERKHLSTTEVVEVFKTSEETANKMIRKIVEDGIGHIIKTTTLPPEDWTCPVCGYENLKFSTHCTDCFQDAPKS